MKRSLVSLLALGSLVVGAAGSLAQAPAASLPRTKAPQGAQVYFIAPENGAQVSSPVTVKFGLKGMGVAPAGIDSPETGHHHVLVDAELANPGLPIPNDATHLHFGKGQTEAQLELAPGRHTLQLVVGDKNHIPHDPPVVSEKITITVK